MPGTNKECEISLSSRLVKAIDMASLAMCMAGGYFPRNSTSQQGPWTLRKPQIHHQPEYDRRKLSNVFREKPLSRTRSTGSHPKFAEVEHFKSVSIRKLVSISSVLRKGGHDFRLSPESNPLS